MIPESKPTLASLASGTRVVEVVPDVSGLDRHFEYAWPDELGAIVPGAIVRVPLGPRRVRAWVLAELAAAHHEGLRPVIEHVSAGPSAEVVELARSAAARYAGWLRPFLLAASPPRQVRSAAPPGPGHRVRPGQVRPEIAAACRDALDAGAATVRLPPGIQRLELVLGVLDALRPGEDLLVLVPTHRDVEVLCGRLVRQRIAVARYPQDWAAAAAGGRVVVGTRNAILATLARPGPVLVLDAHEQAYVSERAPTWRAPVLALERARAGGVACVLHSACPPLELLAHTHEVLVPPALERAGWPPLEVLDRRGDDPRFGLYSPSLATILRAAREHQSGVPVLCVLNRTGRVRLFACGACGELVTCERCGAALGEERRADPGAARELSCPDCGLGRPALCAACGSMRLRLVRIGVGRAAEELAALTGLEVVEVSGASEETEVPPTIVVGTEAALHRARAASLVVFFDLDQHLLAPRFRAAEETLALLARAARLVAAASRGRVVVQTRQVDSPVLEAVRRGDPGLLARTEVERRRELRLPPFAALAELSGEGAPALAAALAAELEVAARPGGTYLVRAIDHAALLAALAGADPVPGARIAVDPLGV